MTKIVGNAWDFYLEGRADRRLRCDTTPSDIVQQLVEKGGAFREVLYEVCQRAANALGDKTKRAWVRAHEEGIKEAEISADDAYAAYVQGRIDELAMWLEQPVIDELQDEDADEEGEEDGADGDDDEDND